ncbi:MAG: toll/interleukin-1 receptor domain-containing protein [Geminicoccaceae bacterium]
MTDPSPLHRVFLSYSMADDSTAQLLRGYLIARGIDVISDDAVGQGEEWDEAVQQGIERSDAIVLLVSPASLRSGAVMYEAGLAFRHSREEPTRLIAILLGDIEPSQVPLPLARSAQIDARSLGNRDLLERVDRALAA